MAFALVAGIVDVSGSALARYGNVGFDPNVIQVGRFTVRFAQVSDQNTPVDMKGLPALLVQSISGERWARASVQGISSAGFTAITTPGNLRFSFLAMGDAEGVGDVGTSVIAAVIRRDGHVLSNTGSGSARIASANVIEQGRFRVRFSEPVANSGLPVVIVNHIWSISEPYPSIGWGSLGDNAGVYGVDSQTCLVETYDNDGNRSSRDFSLLVVGDFDRSRFEQDKIDSFLRDLDQAMNDAAQRASDTSQPSNEEGKAVVGESRVEGSDDNS